MTIDLVTTQNLLHILFQDLQDSTPQHCKNDFKTGKLPENKKKNRFNNITAGLSTIR